MRSIRKLRPGPLLLGVIASAVGVSALTALSLSNDEIRHAALARIGLELETRFDRVSLSQERPIAGIVVLGGNFQRAQAVLELARRYPSALVIHSGPSPFEEKILSTAPELDRRLVVDRRARNTFENALFSRNLAQPKPGEHWLLVTSALHMPRSIGAFRAVGFDVSAWPVHDTVKGGKAHVAYLVQHELFGLLYYRLLGRTTAWFPGTVS